MQFMPTVITFWSGFRNVASSVCLSLEVGVCVALRCTSSAYMAMEMPWIALEMYIALPVIGS